jgi:hypothetical protein
MQRGQRATRKLALSAISKCHPQKTRTRKQSKQSNHCLPRETYQELERVTRQKGKALFTSLGCEDGAEHCLLDRSPLQKDVKDRLRTQYLRPKRPAAWEKKPDTWLDNYNIEHVMRQYEEAFPWFEFAGVFPMDFSAPDPYHKNGAPKCLHEQLCNMVLQDEYDKGKRGIGFIFNLDPHYKGGSHWVALYIDIKDIKAPFIGYCDSYGMRTPPLIARFMRAFTLQIPATQLGFNARRFQYSNTECGMYSLYFLICMIHGITFKNFCKETTRDATMLELRKILFGL